MGNSRRLFATEAELRAQSLGNQPSRFHKFQKGRKVERNTRKYAYGSRATVSRWPTNVQIMLGKMTNTSAHMYAEFPDAEPGPEAAINTQVNTGFALMGNSILTRWPRREMRWKKDADERSWTIPVTTKAPSRVHPSQGQCR